MQAPSEPTARRHSPWFTALSALLVIAACWLAWTLVPHGDHCAPLVGRPTWDLAAALPASEDFPDAWGYTPASKLGQVTPLPTPISNMAITRGVFTPPECGQMQKISQMLGEAQGSGASYHYSAPDLDTAQNFYYVVRGVILQCHTNMDDGDRALIEQLVAQTARKIRAL